ncbi:DUF6979 family protein [Cytobacillus gottheilii]|uniref:DUF6979 family protein n=1 Tax=Cytobacillus gottheilii TaxID=859144 RepID=UPI0009B96986|nr:hypothetical protein [Cytobacillus gottheilii]
MSKYGLAAVKAVEFINESVVDSPKAAWDRATSELFGHGSWGQKKGCPKNAFLGLCEEGFIEAIPQGNYNFKKTSKNKEYANRAVNIIRENKSMIDDRRNLWKEVTNDNKKSHNGQLDVVIALIEKKYIRI